MKKNYLNSLIVLGAFALLLVPEPAWAQGASFFGVLDTKAGEVVQFVHKISIMTAGLGLLLGLAGWATGQPYGKPLARGAALASAALGVLGPMFNWLTGASLF